MSGPGCPNPTNCPVPDIGAVDPSDLQLTVVSAGEILLRVWEYRFGYDEFNPGTGDTRFAPIHDAHGHPIPTLYAARDEIGVLLETVFHDIQPSSRVIYESSLCARGLVHMKVPRPLHLVDLRDDELAHVGLRRDQLVATSPTHYACTRAWSQWIYGLRFGRRVADGITWYSRQAELQGMPNSEVVMLFGRVDGDLAGNRGAFPLAQGGVRNLYEGSGRVLVDDLAEALDAVIERRDP